MVKPKLPAPIKAIFFDILRCLLCKILYIFSI
jgi:hypothetical protein